MTLHGFLARLIWVCILPLVLLSIFLAIDHLDHVEQQRDLVAANLAYNVGSTIDRMIGSQISALKMLASSPLVEEPEHWSDLYKEAQAFRDSFGSHVLMANAEQRMVFSTRAPYGTPLPKLPAVKGHAAAPTALATGKPAIGDMFVGPITGERLVAIAVPIPRGTPAASVFVAVIEAQRLQNRLDDIALPPDWSLTLQDGNGAVIARRAAESAPDRPPRDYTIQSTVTPWRLTLAVPQGVFSSENRAISLSLAGMIVAAILAGMIGGRFASRRLTRSLTALAEAAPPDTATAIDEIDTVHRRLTAAAAAREAALSGEIASTQRFQRLFELAPVPLCFLDRDGTLRDYNTRFERMFGYTRDDVPTLQDWWIRAYPDPDYRNRVIAEWNEAVREAAATRTETVPTEYQITCKDGTVLSVLVSAAVLDNDCLVSLMDITERKRSEAALRQSQAAALEAQHLARLAALNLMEDALAAQAEAEAANAALRESEQRLNLALSASNMGVWAWEIATRAIFSTPGCLAIYGVAELGPSIDDFAARIHPDDAEAVMRGAERAIAERHTFAIEFRIRRPDGAVRWVASLADPVYDEAGAPLRLIGTVQDISERKSIDAELEEYRHHLETLVTARTAELETAEAQVRLILESTADGLYGIDPGGRITFSNPSAGTMLGYSAEQLQGQRAHDLFGRGPVAATSGSELPPSIQDTLRSGRICRVEDAVFRHADGHMLQVSYSSHPMIRSGRIIGAVVSFTDISRRKATEAAREAALAEAERLARVRREFLANMSHEIRTPLTAIMGLARIGAKQAGGGKCQDYFGAILDAGNGLQGVIDDILDFSKIESGKMQIESVPFVIGEVIDRSIRTIAIRAEAKGLRLNVEEAPDLPTECLGDSKRLHQILLNLLSNAVKFTPAGGSVTLSASIETGLLVFRVSDTGIGMSEETVGRLFQPFEQADGSTTRQFGGTGLGLAISAHLAKLMQGTISVRTAPDQGSTFDLRLPLAGAVTAPPPPRGDLGMFGLRWDEIALLRDAFAECRALTSLTSIPAAALTLIDAAALALPDNRPGIDAALAAGRRLAGVTVPGLNDIPSDLRDAISPIERPLRIRHVRAELAASRKGGLSVVLAPPLARLSGLSILAAEDNEVNRLVLEDILSGEGAAVSFAENGRIALDTLRLRGGDAFDIVLTDIQMPEMDGYDLAAAIRTLTPPLPVIGLTAHAMAEERQRCLDAGMVEHVVKPIDPELLIAAIRHHARPAHAAAPPAAVPDIPTGREERL